VERALVVLPQNDQLVGLVGRDEDGHSQFAQQRAEVGRVDASQRGQRWRGVGRGRGIRAHGRRSQGGRGASSARHAPGRAGRKQNEFTRGSAIVPTFVKNPYWIATVGLG